MLVSVLAAVSGLALTEPQAAPAAGPAAASAPPAAPPAAAAKELDVTKDVAAGAT